jgi:hypothetical protein
MMNQFHVINNIIYINNKFFENQKQKHFSYTPFSKQLIKKTIYQVILDNKIRTTCLLGFASIYNMDLRDPKFSCKNIKIMVASTCVAELEVSDIRDVLNFAR